MEKIPMKQARANRPKRDEAMNAIYDAYLQLKCTIKILEDVFTRENDYQIQKSLRRKPTRP